MTREEKVLSLINELLEKQDRVVVAIDGRCAGGKTTLALNLAKMCDCNVIHIDDFFLRPEQRTPQRLSQPGENIDHERFKDEVLLPLCSGESFCYKPFSCSTGQLSDEICVTPKRINIVEGSYCLNKHISDYYDLKLFVNVTSDEQMTRILKRDGSVKAKVYAEKWIPLEEKYFKAYDLMNNCDAVL